MKVLFLPGQQQCFVDDEDYDSLIGKWTVNDSGYAVRWNNNLKLNQRMHRVILDAPIGLDVDHIDGNRLNNQRSNLRIATRNMNNGNRNVRQDSISGIKGVRFYQNKWQARIVQNYKEIHLGRFNTAGEAARAYNQAALIYFGEFAKLNLV